MNKVTIVVKDHKRIPFLPGRGPTTSPVKVTRKQYESLLKMGFNVVIVDKIRKPKISISETKHVAEEIKFEENIEPIVEEEVVEETVTEEEVVGEPTHEEEVEPAVEDETVEEIIEDEEVEYTEVLVDDENLSAESYYNEDFLTKSIAIKILEARGVEHNPNNNAQPLKDLVMKTNPIIE